MRGVLCGKAVMCFKVLQLQKLQRFEGVFVIIRGLGMIAFKVLLPTEDTEV